MRNVAGFALTTAAVFLAVVAILLNAPSLFYMATALIATLCACQFQAWLSVRALRFERIAPATAALGDLITVEITVWSERKVRRPLITIHDRLPSRLKVSFRSPSLPIAPAYDLPIRTQYQFRALRRGHYKWSGLVARGTDALGLVTKEMIYDTAPTELTVLPRPIPLSVELPAAAGWGISEAQSGQTRGAGIEPRGIREYATGDSLRHVHWASSARRGQLLVKEFEAGTHAEVAFILQISQGTDVGKGTVSSLDAMCGHALFLAEEFLRKGARLRFPQTEAATGHDTNDTDRLHEIASELAGLVADRSGTMAEFVNGVMRELPMGSVVFLLLAVRDDSLPATISALSGRGLQVVALLYDAHAFLDKSAARAGKRSATDPDYHDALRAAGAMASVVPMQGVLDDPA
jgi:uncharacterized protein (DUF58 family)